MTAQQRSPVADTDSGASGSAAPEKKTSRAGRNPPAAIAVGVLLGAMAIGEPAVRAEMVAAVAGHRDRDRHPRGGPPASRTRLRDARRPTAYRRSGDDLACLAVGVAGTLAPTAAPVVVAMVGARRQGSARAAGQLPARHRRHDPARHQGAVVRQFHLADDLPAQRRWPVFTVIATVVFADIGGYIAGCCSAASAGAGDQPEEVMGGTGRLAAVRHHRGRAVGDVPAAPAGLVACRSG